MNNGARHFAILSVASIFPGSSLKIKVENPHDKTKVTQFFFKYEEILSKKKEMSVFGLKFIFIFMLIIIIYFAQYEKFSLFNIMVIIIT